MSGNISNDTMVLEHPTSDDMLRVWIYVFVTLIQLIPYTLILWIIYKDPKTYGAPVYKIIFHLGIADCIILIFHFTELPFTIFQVSPDFWAAKLCGAIMNGIDFSFIHFTLMLAFNRFVTISLNPNSVNAINSKILKIWINLTWLSGIIVAAWFLSPFFNVYFDVKTLTWNFDDRTGGLFPYIDLGISVSQFLLAAIIYLLTILKLVFIKSNYTTKKDLRNEIKLFIQAIIIGLYCAFGTVYWNFICAHIDPSYSGFIGNLLWNTQNGMNPYLYLAMNSLIRKSFIQFFVGSRFKNHPTSNPPPKQSIKITVNSLVQSAP